MPRPPRTAQWLPMNTKEMLSDEELAAQASLWRTRALQGEFEARGIAHELEREMRRRAGAPRTNYDTLELRPLDGRPIDLPFLEGALTCPHEAGACAAREPREMLSCLAGGA